MRYPRSETLKDLKESWEDEIEDTECDEWFMDDFHRFFYEDNPDDDIDGMIQ